LSAGSLRIETFEGSRSRLGQTRAIIGIRIDIPLDVTNYWVVVKFEFLMHFLFAVVAVHIVVVHACGGVVTSADFEAHPPTKVRPVRSELVNVSGLSKARKVNVSTGKLLLFDGGDLKGRGRVIGRKASKTNIMVLAGEKERHLCGDMRFSRVAERRWLRRFNEFHDRFYKDLPGWSFAHIRNVSVQQQLFNFARIWFPLSFIFEPYFQPSAIFHYQLVLHNRYLQTGAIGLPLYLSQRDERKDSEYYGSDNPDKADYADNPLAFLAEWAITLLGLVIGGYCWWQANYRPYSREGVWLLAMACALALFAYGVCLLTNRALESV
jgi:hypothetical protein